VSRCVKHIPQIVPVPLRRAFSLAGQRPKEASQNRHAWLRTKKTQPLWGCAKSTPKEEGGGDKLLIRHMHRMSISTDKL